jgi:hypothetical protein
LYQLAESMAVRYDGEVVWAAAVNMEEADGLKL